MSDPSPSWPRDVLRERRERTPGRLALVDVGSDRRFTYAEFDALVDRLAGSLAASGVTEGGTVATLLDTRPISVGLPFATIRTGVTLAPLNVELDGGTLQDQIDRLDPVLVLCERETEPLAVDLGGHEVRTVDPPGDSSLEPFGRDDRPGELATEHRSSGGAPPSDSSPAEVGSPLGPTEDALVVFTSGTTGHPRGVRLTVGNLLWSATASAGRLGVTPRDRWFSPLPTYHVGGIAPAIRATFSGTATVVQPEFDADRTMSALERYDATCASFVPTMLDRVLDAGWRPGPAIRFVLLGGGPVPVPLLERCAELGVPVCPTYGATETASQVATATPGEAHSHPGTVGRPLLGATVSVDEDHGNVDVADGEHRDEAGGDVEDTDDEHRDGDVWSIGEFVVEGPMVSPGYIGGDGSGTLADGRFHSGDLGYRDDAGRLWIVGRDDDVIASGGENVRPGVVADALREHPAVSDVAVVGLPDDEWGERVAALVVREGEVAAGDLRSFCRDRVATFAVPKTVAFVEDLPRTPSGTIDREAVREHFQ